MSDEDDIVVDASVVLAGIQREPFRNFDPARVVQAAISTLNLSEVWTKLISADFTPAEAAAATAPFNFRVFVFDEDQARVASGLWSKTRRLGLSLGDRACLALALTLKKPAVTADRAWSKLDIGAEIVLIR